MNGPGHYAEAERLLAHSRAHVDQGNVADDKIAELAAAQAQAHATLALAAVTERMDVAKAARAGSRRGTQAGAR